MTKAEVIVAIADKTGVDKASVSTTLESFFEILVFWPHSSGVGLEQFN